MNDILLDDDLDLAIENGDFVIGDSEEQHQELILIAFQGSFRASPLTGIGITRYYKASFSVGNIDKLRQKIRLQMQYDGYKTVKTAINSFEDIEIEAER